MRIQNIIELYQKIEGIASTYGILGNVEIDNGYSFSYQVQVYFMTYYQKQVIESSFGRYNQLVRDPLESRNTANQSNQKLIDIKEMIGRPDLTEIDQLYAKFDCDVAEDFSEI